jgi:hypothetical protein
MYITMLLLQYMSSDVGRKAIRVDLDEICCFDPCKDASFEITIVLAHSLSHCHPIPHLQPFLLFVDSSPPVVDLKVLCSDDD